ncbi:hypothetical protein EMGBD4_16100, partial [Verrucomicrobiota bacterium]
MMLMWKSRQTAPLASSFSMYPVGVLAAAGIAHRRHGERLGTSHFAAPRGVSTPVPWQPVSTPSVSGTPLIFTWIVGMD